MSQATIQHLVHKLLIDLVREDMKAMVARGRTMPVPAEALAQFIAGGFLGLLMWWLDGKMRPSVEEVNTIFRRLAIPSVRATLR